MSVEILLIPLGIAAVAALSESVGSQGAQSTSTRYATRIKDASLVREALAEGGYSAHQTNPDRYVVDSHDGVYVVENTNGIFEISSISKSSQPQVLADTLNLLSGKVLQRRNLTAIEAEAERMGLTLIQKADEDGTVHLIYEGELRA